MILPPDGRQFKSTVEFISHSKQEHNAMYPLHTSPHFEAPGRKKNIYIDISRSMQAAAPTAQQAHDCAAGVGMDIAEIRARFRSAKHGRAKERGREREREREREKNLRIAIL